MLQTKHSSNFQSRSEEIYKSSILDTNQQKTRPLAIPQLNEPEDSEMENFWGGSDDETIQKSSNKCRKDTKMSNCSSKKNETTFNNLKQKSTLDVSSIVTFASPTLPKISIQANLLENICILLEYLAT